MELDKTGWPQLPQPGTKIRFTGGDLILQIYGVCEIVKVWHTTNASGKPGGKVELKTEKGGMITVLLSQVRDHAVELSRQEAEAARREKG